MASSSCRQGTNKSFPELSSTSKPSTKINDIIILFTELLNNWDNYGGSNKMPIPEVLLVESNEADPIKIFATKIYFTNFFYQDHFIYAT